MKKNLLKKPIEKNRFKRNRFFKKPIQNEKPIHEETIGSRIGFSESIDFCPSLDRRSKNIVLKVDVRVSELKLGLIKLDNAESHLQRENEKCMRFITDDNMVHEFRVMDEYENDIIEARFFVNEKLYEIEKEKRLLIGLWKLIRRKREIVLRRETVLLICLR